MKKSIVYILALVMAFSMMGCGMNKTERRAQETPNSATITENYRNEANLPERENSTAGGVIEDGNRNVTGEAIINNEERDERVVTPVNP